MAKPIAASAAATCETTVKTIVKPGAAAEAAAPAAAASMMLSINRLHVSYQQVQLIGEVSILQNPVSSITFN